MDSVICFALLKSITISVTLQHYHKRHICAAEARRIQAERTDYSWVPSGFTKFSINNNMAYKKIGYDAADCYGDCFGMQVVSRDYCSSITIEANVVKNGVIVETNTDYASNIPAGTPTIMKMAGSFSGTLSWTKVECT